MSDKIQVIEPIPHYSAHIVPCKIHYTGTANTEDYFTPSKEVDPTTQAQICYFRGCKFTGKPLEIKGHKGYFINKSESLAPGDTPDDFKVVNTYTTVGAFEDITLYGHERMPKSTDAYNLIPEWYQISDAIHGDDDETDKNSGV